MDRDTPVCCARSFCTSMFIIKALDAIQNSNEWNMLEDQTLTYTGGGSIVTLHPIRYLGIHSTLCCTTDLEVVVEAC